jgi:hypothetical protein
VSARSRADLAEVVADPAPEDVAEELYRAELERRTP